MARPKWNRSTPALAARALAALALAAPLTLASAAVAEDDDDDILVDEDEEVETSEEQTKLGLATLVPVGDADKRLADQVAEGIKKELSEGYELVDIALGSDEETGAEVDLSAGASAKEAADKQLAKAAKYLKKLNFGRAEKAFNKAIEGYEEAAAALTDVGPLLQAHLGIAEVAARQGEEDVARAALSAVVRLNPEHELDKSRFPPLFVSTHEEVRAEILKEKKASIVVDHSGVGAQVFVDGREVGTAPLKVIGLPPGKHLVRVFREDAGLHGELVEVGGGKSATVKPGFFSSKATGALDLLARNRFSDAAAKQVAELGKAAGVPIVLLGVVGKGKASVPAALVAVDVASGKAARMKTLDFDGDLLNLSIESLKAREKINELRAKGGYKSIGDAPLLEGVKAGAAVEVAEVAMRYDVKATPRKPRGRRVVGDAEPEAGEEIEGTAGPIGAGGRAVLAAGGSGATKSMRDDEEDPLERREKKRSDFVAEEDAPLTEQIWFWPTVIGGGVAGALALTGGTVIGLVALDILPDPRERTGMQVTVSTAEGS
jgi:tetratricopeptide (TPR) repeat protein